MGQCIYCRGLLSGSEPPEHVIPQSFGTFQGNLTIFAVCSECNRFFGRTLEWPMRNSSAEGVLRFSYGLATGGQIGNIGTNGIEFTIAESGEWFGARVVLKVNEQTGKPYIDLIAQVGARRNPTEEWTWYLEKDVDEAFAAKYQKGSEFRIIGCEGDFQQLEERLTKVCPSFQRKGTLSPPIGSDGMVGINFINDFDAVVRRCLAKIALNYLTWVRGAEFVLGPQFDAVRSFIRYGTEPSVGIVYINQRPIVAQELFGGSQITDGHILTVEGKPHERRVEVRLALFNSLKYRIILSTIYDGLVFAKGHHFDVLAREVSEMVASQIVQPVVF